MALFKDKIEARTKDVRIPYAGDALQVSYRPSAWTPAVTIKLQELEGAAQTAYALEVLESLLADWDFLEYEGGPKVPITQDELMSLDQDLANAIIDGIAADMRPKSGTEKP